MDKALIVIAVFVCLSVLFAGCSQQKAAEEPPQNFPPVTEKPNVMQPVPDAQKPEPNVTQPQPPQFKPIHLSYRISVLGGPNGGTQQVGFDYYFTEKTDCSGRPALNGFVRMAEAAYPDRASYSKITAYLDSGEAVYSDRFSEPDLAFDTAKPLMADFDPAFWPQTIAARGNKNLLSAEIWNGKKPVLLRNVAVFGGNGDYSITAGQNSSVAGFDCKNITISVKASNMDGQMITCVHKLADLDFSFIASANALGGAGFQWSVKSLSREEPSTAYYPQCLAPVSCPSVSKPAQQEYTSCGTQGKSIESTRDGKGCVTAYTCMANDERARKNIAGNQNPDCAVDEKIVKENADCWSKQGNVDYQRNEQTGCITGITCNLPPEGQGMPPRN